MGFLSLISSHLAGRLIAQNSKATRRRQAAPLSPRRLERRRVLDAGAAEVLLGTPVDSSEYVQTDEAILPQQSEATGVVSGGPSNVELLLDTDRTVENGVVKLGVSFEDANIAGMHTAVIDWGDGTAPETITIDPGTRFLVTSHQYFDDNPTATAVDFNTINVQVLDATGASASAETLLQVSNVAPSIDFLSVTPTVDENGFAQLQLAFADPGTQDTHTVEVDWGDGSAVETITLDPGSRFLVTSHQYLDDNPTATSQDPNTVQVKVLDDDGGSATAEKVTLVSNIAPTIDFFSVTPMVDENGFAQLQLAFTDPGTQDTHTVEVDWGDGSALETITLDPGSRFLVTSHQYLDDNPTATLQDIYKVNVKVADDDGGMATAERDILVKNVAPVVEDLTVTPMINENGIAQLQLAFTDVGSQDTHVVEIDWGDGSPLEQLILDPGTQFVVTSHRYLDDDPSITSSDTYTVKVDVIDDDGGKKTATTEILVKNVAPVFEVAANPMVDEGALVDLSTGTIITFSDVGTLDTHAAVINWGDGSPPQLATTSFDGSTGTLNATHRYADNGVYTVKVTLVDDDLGSAVKEFEIRVKNVDPSLNGLSPLPVVNEGEAFTLAGLGINLTDPGFDNPLNPLVSGGSQETFTGLTVDWGDGTPADTLSVVNRVSGSPGVATTADFLHDPHTYADNGLYTVTVTVSDDDGGFVMRTFQIQVNNVDPTLVLTDRNLEINEGDTLNLFDLGVFSDPGFDNPLNLGDPSNGGEVVETFSYTIDWGDGTVETGQLPASVVNGAAGIETMGTLVDSHQYLDNDADNLYTITVTLTDDDGGSTTQQIQVRVLNVNPSLDPIIATDLTSGGKTFLTLDFADPGTEVLTVWVDWGDQLALPPDQRFVAETIEVGPGAKQVVLEHTYTGPPNPMNPAADIVISAFIRDDDFGMPLVVDPGQSVTRVVAITNPGEGVNPVRIDTTPQVPRLIFPQSEDATFFASATSADESGSNAGELRAAAGDAKATTDRFLELRVIDPATGQESQGYRLKPEVLNDLPGLFRTLPDNRYAIYLVRTETNTRRLVIEVFVRNGKLIDPGDDSEGTRDRPPTDETLEAPQQDLPRDENPTEIPDQNRGAATAQPAAVDHSWSDAPQLDHAWRSSQQRTRMLLASAAVGLAVSGSGRSWTERIDRAVANADSRKWRQLRRRNPYNQKKG